MYDHQYAVSGSFVCFLLIVGVIGFMFYLFFKSNLWKYINTPKQKTWQLDFLLKGEELRVVRTPYSYPEGIVIINYGYGHDIITSDKDKIIYWRESDYFKAKRLYEDQILAES